MSKIICMLLPFLLFLACTEHTASEDKPPAVPVNTIGTEPEKKPDSDEQKKLAGLVDQIAEFERSGFYKSGLGVIESTFLERMGNYPGAVLAAFKDMLWNYGCGAIDRQEVLQGLVKITALEERPGMEIASVTARALLDFMYGNIEKAKNELAAFSDDQGNPDSFINWILLSCTLEKNPGDIKAQSAYRSIRARYVQFPDFWYRGAKAFTGAIASQYAESCINLAPGGPYAAECRSILASQSGLKAEDSNALRSKTEIENLAFMALEQENPQLLDPLLPLIDLPENPFTVYAIGVMKGLASMQIFNEYFSDLAAGSMGRMSERLLYICRG